MEKRRRRARQRPAVPVRHRCVPRRGDAHRAALGPVDRPDARGVQLPLVHDRAGRTAARPAIRLLRRWRRVAADQRVAGAGRRAALPAAARSVRRPHDRWHRGARAGFRLRRGQGPGAVGPEHRRRREGCPGRRQRRRQEHAGATATRPLQCAARQHPLRRGAPGGNRPGLRARTCRGGPPASGAVQRQRAGQPDHGPRTQ